MADDCHVDSGVRHPSIVHPDPFAPGVTPREIGRSDGAASPFLNAA